MTNTDKPIFMSQTLFNNLNCCDWVCPLGTSQREGCYGQCPQHHQETLRAETQEDKVDLYHEQLFLGSFSFIYHGTV